MSVESDLEERVIELERKVEVIRQALKLIGSIVNLDIDKESELIRRVSANVKGRKNAG